MTTEQEFGEAATTAARTVSKAYIVQGLNVERPPDNFKPSVEHQNSRAPEFVVRQK